MAELWRLGNVSLGLSATTEMDRVCCEEEEPITLREIMLLLRKLLVFVLSGLDPLFLRTGEGTEDMHLEAGYKTGEVEQEEFKRDS